MGHFQMSYANGKSSTEYVDYASENWMNYYKAFKAILEIDADKDGTAEKTQESEAIQIAIDTNATIKSVVKKNPTLYTSWNSNWGVRPADAADYYYLVWPVESEISSDLTQTYDFTLTDSLIQPMIVSLWAIICKTRTPRFMVWSQTMKITLLQRAKGRIMCLPSIKKAPMMPNLQPTRSIV